jgi:hypothetical protein
MWTRSSSLIAKRVFTITEFIDKLRDEDELQGKVLDYFGLKLEERERYLIH